MVQAGERSTRGGVGAGPVNLALTALAQASRPHFSLGLLGSGIEHVWTRTEAFSAPGRWPTMVALVKGRGEVDLQVTISALSGHNETSLPTVIRRLDAKLIRRSAIDCSPDIDGWRRKPVSYQVLGCGENGRSFFAQEWL